jgi:hypothetical protein
MLLVRVYVGERKVRKSREFYGKNGIGQKRVIGEFGRAEY